MTPTHPHQPAKQARQTKPGMRRRWDSGQPRLALTLSGVLHAVMLTGFLIYNSLSIHSLPAVPVFEMVPTPPKLEPLAPKTPEPPPPPPKVETRAPDAPKLATKPKPPPVVRHEPKVVRTAIDTSRPVKEVTPQAQQLTTHLDVPSDSRLSFWASRVKKLVDSRWNPPDGMQVQGLVKTVVSFQVARAGTISGVEVSQSSGNTLLDQMAQEAIQRLDQLPPIPENYPQDILQVSYEFVYQGQ